MSRAFGVFKEPKSCSEHLSNRCRPIQPNPINLNVNLITKLDLSFIEVVDANGRVDPNGTLFRGCKNYLRYLVDVRDSI